MEKKKKKKHADKRFCFMEMPVSLEFYNPVKG